MGSGRRPGSGLVMGAARCRRDQQQPFPASSAKPPPAFEKMFRLIAVSALPAALFLCAPASAEGFVTGRVTDTEGTPVAGASIQFFDEDNPRDVFGDTTAGDGSYSVVLPLPTSVEAGAVRAFPALPELPQPLQLHHPHPLQPGHPGACGPGGLQPARTPGPHPGKLVPARRRAHDGLGRQRREGNGSLCGGVPVPPAVMGNNGRRQDDPDPRRRGKGGRASERQISAGCRPGAEPALYRSHHRGRYRRILAIRHCHPRRGECSTSRSCAWTIRRRRQPPRASSWRIFPGQ